MASFENLIHKRRSCREYAERDILADDVSRIIESGLLSPTARNSQKWHFYVVDDRLLLQKLADAKDRGSQFIGRSALCIILSCDEKEDEYWIEDCSIAAVTMQYQAEDLGISSCWCQIRGSYLSDGTSSEDVVRGIAGIDDSERVLCMIGFGYKKDNVSNVNGREAQWERVQIIENS